MFTEYFRHTLTKAVRFRAVMMALPVFMSALITVAPVKAIMPCRLHEHNFEFLGYSPKYHQFAVRQDFQFCIEDSPVDSLNFNSWRSTTPEEM